MPISLFEQTPCRDGKDIAMPAIQDAPPPPLPLLSAWIRRMLSEQSTDQTMRVLEGMAELCRRLSVYLCLSNDHPRYIIAGIIIIIIIISNELD